MKPVSGRWLITMSLTAICDLKLMLLVAWRHLFSQEQMIFSRDEDFGARIILTLSVLLVTLAVLALRRSVIL